ncbi:lambda exonuclease family protein [Xanthomonas citri]|uniref:lambda exonuclease family protein n=1 Tax=Xanthomonas citri TaxID=346 RepID=UPI00103C8CFA|nr:lambda exonuclease family protein [Xanthomonas citri]MCC8492327.1 YqaJ viral recombinase family protein [Xanthomonas citri pv. fuscans]TBW96710.1 recombinase [Xanthomonas citri pv. aurantifolii]TBX03221.1 recombinase [Xanthomonas citri pv. aurantifolii]
MIILTCDQGSDAWLHARAGVITASMFATARKRVGELDERQQAYVDGVLSGLDEKVAAKAAGYAAVPRAAGIAKALRGEPVGDYSEEAQSYAFRLAIERGSGEPLDEGFETHAMRRGHELEPFARAEFEVQTGLMVQRAGFVLTDDGVFGASADGLIGGDDGIEIKCFIDPTRIRRFHVDNDFSEVFEQAQGCMWITGRQWWHIALYCPALAYANKQLLWRRFERDDAFIENMRDDLLAFRSMVDAFECELKREAA